MTDATDEKVQWLVDRALISDLLFSFARALDTRDFDAYVNNFTEDGTLELPTPPPGSGSSIILQRDQLLDTLQGLKKFSKTHHISTNHQITIDKDAASSHSYLQAVHVGASPFDHWDAGGWYDCQYRRTPEGWKFTRVKLTEVWLAGDPRSVLPE
jgi:ketosteroid isomerase-like protein